MIQLNVRKEKLFIDCDEEKLFKVIKASFMQRRKTLLNGLVNAGIASKEKVREAILKINQEENIRGEKLTIEQFAELAKYLK